MLPGRSKPHYSGQPPKLLSIERHGYLGFCVANPRVLATAMPGHEVCSERLCRVDIIGFVHSCHAVAVFYLCRVVNTRVYQAQAVAEQGSQLSSAGSVTADAAAADSQVVLCNFSFQA